MNRKNILQLPELMADPFYTLGRIDSILNDRAVKRTPSQRVSAANEVIREWRTAKEKLKAAGKTIFVKGLT